MVDHKFDKIYMTCLLSFGINLENGAGEILLHINPRWDESELVLNTLPADDEWGEEYREPLQLAEGADFIITIAVLEDGYTVCTYLEWMHLHRFCLRA